MAYAAVISFKQTITRLLNSSHISIISSSREIVEFAYNEVTSLQSVLKRLDDRRSSSKKLDTLDGEIRDAVHNIEDLLESHVSDLFLSHSESYGDEGSSRVRSLDLEEARQQINYFAETVKKKKEEDSVEADNPVPEEDDEPAASSNIDSGVEMVGFSKEFIDTKYQMLTPTRPADSIVFSIVGRTGSGKTIIARSIFEEYIGQKQCFDFRAWVTIGQKYEFKDILIRILAQIDDPAVNNGLLISEGDEILLAEHLYASLYQEILLSILGQIDNPGGNDESVILEGDEKLLAECLHRRLEERRYLIVLDDICDTQIWDKLKGSFSEEDNGSVVLLTTGLREIPTYAESHYTYEIFTLVEDVCWDYLRLVMFGFDSSPPEFEEAGRKIARNCAGINISLAKVLVFLWNAEKTPAYWNELAADTENSIFTVADEISEIRKIQEDANGVKIQEDANGVILSTFIQNVMNSFTSHIEAIRMELFPKRFFPKMEVMSFIGMAGIGKTTFVKKIFEDLLILHYFNYRAWVTIGPKYQSEDIVVDILAQMYPDIDKMHMKGDAKLVKELCARLSNKRCFIVLDDVWDKEPLHHLNKQFSDIRGKTLVTTRLAKVAHFEKFDRVYKVRLLNNEESWDLLRKKVFAEELCPPELEKAGKKIAENCEGVPLTIVTVANLLSEVEKTPEYWNNVAEKRNSLFMNAYREMSRALLPSYKSIPQHLKACIFYMGVFSQNYEISTSKLIKFWSAEGFLEPNLSQTVEDFAAECLSDLIDRSLLMVCQMGSHFGVKTCRLHSVFWFLSNNEAAKNKFFYAFNTYADNSVEGIKNQRRLCIRNSILFGIKDVHNSMASISTARSLLCTGPHHQYPVPICLDLRLLRVLDLLTIRFYEFPVEVVKLIHLRYLGLTCSGKLPASISELWNLHFLIVNRYLSIKSFGDSLCLPVEIWDMKELKHLQIMGSNLPNLICGAALPNLFTLLDVSANSCSEVLLKGIPNLKRLGIQIELVPDDDGKSFHCLNHISCLTILESLKCVVVNPELRTEVFAPPPPILMFPSGLKKLSLSGIGYPWVYMSILGKLENLEVLKLRCYAFRGREWETGDGNFMKLKYLLIEDTNLVCWKRTVLSFARLKHLSIKHCYKLEELPSHLAPCIEMIEVTDCTPFTLTWAIQMEQQYLSNPNNMDTGMKAYVHSSWDAGTSQVRNVHWAEKVSNLILIIFNC